MISNPKCGWCRFQIGDFRASASYLTDVPMDLLDAFIDYHEKGSGVVVFDREGSFFTLVLSAYNNGIFIIEEGNDSKLHNLCDFFAEKLEKELIDDIELELSGWAHFTTDDDEADIRLRWNNLQQKVEKLKSYS